MTEEQNTEISNSLDLTNNKDQNSSNFKLDEDIEKYVALGKITTLLMKNLANPTSATLSNLQTLVRRTDPNQAQNLEIAKQSGIDLFNLQNYLRDRGLLKIVEDIQEASSIAANLIGLVIGFINSGESSKSPENINTLISHFANAEKTKKILKNKFLLKGKDASKAPIEITLNLCAETPMCLCSPYEMQEILLGLLEFMIALSHDKQAQTVFHFTTTVTNTELIVRLQSNVLTTHPELFVNQFQATELQERNLYQSIHLILIQMIIQHHYAGKIIPSLINDYLEYTIRIPLDQ